MRDLAELRDLHAEVPEPDPARLAPGRARLLAANAAARPVRPRFRRRTVLAGTALGGAVLAAAAIVAVPVVSTDGSPPPALAAAEVLNRAARAAEASPDPVPRDDQFIYTEAVQRWSMGGEPVKSYRNQRWESVDGRHRGLSYDHGVKRIENPATAQPDDVFPMNYAALARLPHDPAQLRACLTSGPPGARRDTRRHLRQLTARMALAQPVLPPGLRPALFRAFAGLPGIALRRNVADALGRRGIGVLIGGGTGARMLDFMVILDPKTYRFLGTALQRPVRTNRPPADVTALVRSGIVDAPGRLP
ncbi:hypothetical protein BTM25_01260 [Actinomadura rubteroloni]|uniref:CU044_5270 family protein n=1 Tax=Actinomadura rubteroloni TaxID=1926885 RepID=A0A2P4UL17_9ACTN|nr:CU044_5270 family protein [Actinomadura rubteroloni]POM25743.1 hypothetical protein BTM25_01260 [Actinomadura rubteroloni]